MKTYDINGDSISKPPVWETVALAVTPKCPQIKILNVFTGFFCVLIFFKFDYFNK